MHINGWFESRGSNSKPIDQLHDILSVECSSHIGKYGGDKNEKILHHLSASPFNLSSTGADPGSGRRGLTPREGMPATSRGQAWVRGFGISVLPMVVPLPSLFLPFPILLWSLICSARMESLSERIGFAFL